MITCVGIGPGSLKFITQEVLVAVQNADVVAGFDAVLNIVSPIISPEAEIVAMTYRNQTEQLEHVARLHKEGKTCVVAFMGDIHFSGFQYLERVEKACGHAVTTIPGISSAQVLASRGKVCFDETTFVTFHRRGELEPFKQHLSQSLKLDRNAIVIPRPWDFMPEQVAIYLIGEGVSKDLQVEVWENLTMREAEWKGSLAELSKIENQPSRFSDMCIILIRSANPFPSQIFTEGQTAAQNSAEKKPTDKEKVASTGKK